MACRRQPGDDRVFSTRTELLRTHSSLCVTKRPDWPRSDLLMPAFPKELCGLVADEPEQKWVPCCGSS